DLAVDGSLVAVLQNILEFLGGVLNGFLLTGIQLVAMLFQRLARGMQQGVSLVTGKRQFGHAMVFLGIGLGILHHALDLIIAQAGIGLDGDLVFLARTLVLGGYVQDA